MNSVKRKSGVQATRMNSANGRSSNPYSIATLKRLIEVRKKMWAQDHKARKAGQELPDSWYEKLAKASDAIQQGIYDLIRSGHGEQAAKLLAQVQATPRKNSASAAELAEAFHGRPARKETEVVEFLEEHSELADLGALEEIELQSPKGVTIQFQPGTRLASNPAGTQLYLVGGDQEVDLKAFAVDQTKDSILLGTVKSVTYVTAKQHLGEADKRPGPYKHDFADEGGGRPVLLDDRVNRLLSFASGNYRIKKDIAGRYSAGIRN